MKRFAAIFGAAVLLSVLCTACQSKELPDTYVEDSDYQYMNMESLHFTLRHVRGSKGPCVLHGDYIYFIDEGSNTILPLCNNADCLHDQETDPEKYAYCNACMRPTNGFPTGELGISYCNGFLYCLDRGFNASSPPFLYRLSEDGSKKEQVYQWDNCSINEWLIHRDVLYFTKQFHEKVDGKMKEFVQLMSLSLTDLTKREEPVFIPDEDLTVATLGKPKAYGNHLYFQIIAYTPSEEEISDDNYLTYLYYKTFVYDILNDQVTELVLPDMSPTEFTSGIEFWDGKILLHSFDPETDDSADTDYYIAELDGSDAEIFMTDIPKYYEFASDGTYLYLTNAHEVARGKEDADKLMYEVFNENLEKVDTFKPPTTLLFEEILPLGTDAMYLQYNSGDENSTGWGVVRWDKQIGTYHGDPIDKDVIDIPR